MVYENIGPVHLDGMSPINRKDGDRDMVSYRSEADEELGDLEESL